MDSIEEENMRKCAFPLARYVYLGERRPYYPFGNTPAEDFLENCLNNSQPSILALGCGDLRCCFYTLWKNFDSSISTAPPKFDGVTFTLNDYNAAVLARNILFLHMCLHLPEDSVEKKKWLCAMWAIWYCHELYPNHINILDATLKALVMFSESSESWSSKDNPLHRFVQFTSSTTFSKVAETWRMWLSNRTIRTEVMHESRSLLLKESIRDMNYFRINFSRYHTDVHGEEDKVQTRKANAGVPEIRSYFEIGSCYAENVIDSKILKKSPVEVNITMYERLDGHYTSHFRLMPFDCYYQTIKFTAQLVTTDKGLAHDLIVPIESFSANPFLANSFQQFAMWIQSSSRVLKNKNIPIMFNIDCQDAIAFCQQLLQQNKKQILCNDGIANTYDVITTSNLMDHLSPSNVVITCVSLLKVDGILVTTSMATRNCTNTGEEFLNLCFGFNSQLFPVVLGVRCISHEGEGCSNPVMIKPFLTDLTHNVYQGLPNIRTFVWVKVPNAQKLTFSKLPRIEDGNITEALVNMVGFCVYGLLNRGPGESVKTLCFNGIETAISMLERYTSLSDKSALNYSYWEPLCTALKCVMSPFLYCFQTQALLHNTHVHLTYSKEDCPICQEKALENTLGLFCAKIDLASPKGTPQFIAFIHHFSCYTDPTFLLQKAQESSNNVHIFDCFDVEACNSNLQLKFFAPLEFVEKKFLVSVAMVNKMRLCNDLSSVISITLKDIQIPWTEYDFSYAKLPTQLDSTNEANSLFGMVTSHVCDGYKTETKISLSKTTSEALSTTKLSTDKISPREVSLSCNSVKFQLNLSYPINFDTLKMEVSSDILTVSCERQAYSLEEERPCFIVSPDHCLSMVNNVLKAETVQLQSSMQMTNKESQFLSKNTSHPNEVQLKVKIFLRDLFKHATSGSFFSIAFGTKVQCLLVINKVLYDYQHRTPAIDLAFCFGDESVMKSVSDSLKAQPMSLSQAELEYLKKVLVYFSRRTNGTLLSAGSTSNYTVLQECKVIDAFTRCVLYFLLCNPDIKFYGPSSSPEDLSQKMGVERCVWCNKLSFTTKKCARCAEVRYCSRKCQKSHWSTHKRMCIKKVSPEATKTTQNAGESASSDLPKCTCCKRQSNNLKKCTRCQKVSYCNSDCQKKHWPQHKKVCTA